MNRFDATPNEADQQLGDAGAEEFYRVPGLALRVFLARVVATVREGTTRYVLDQLERGGDSLERLARDEQHWARFAASALASSESKVAAAEADALLGELRERRMRGFRAADTERAPAPVAEQRTRAAGFLSLDLMLLISVVSIVGAFLAASCLGGCGGCPGMPPAPVVDDAGEAVDAGVDAPADARLDVGTDADAGDGGALCCTTGQNILACDPSDPFTCDVTATHPTDAGCDDPRCMPGMMCQGFNGQGVVVRCGP